jgi:hypothetical protein
MSVEKFRKIPVVIEAMQVPRMLGSAGQPELFDVARDVAAWCGGELDQVSPSHRPEIFIKTLEGIMCASPGDWIIRGIKGEFYPCKPDIFAATYEAVSA